MLGLLDLSETQDLNETAAPQPVDAVSVLGPEGIEFRPMVTEDRQAMLAFTDRLPEDDLLFLRLDITQPETIDEWIRNIEAGRTSTVLASVDARIAGYGSIHHNTTLWTRHLGEMRLMVAPPHRGRGLGSALATRVFALARSLGLFKVTAQMMSSQHTAQNLLHRLGFIPEAQLHDWVIDRRGRTHDLIVMSREVEED